MAGNTYTNTAQRIGKVKGDMIAHAEATEVLGITGRQFSMKKNTGNQIVFRRIIPWGATTTSVSTQNRPSATANAHILQEGVTPAEDALTPVDVTWTLQQYGALYKLTDKVSDLFEDDIEEEAKIQVSERMALVREMVRYGGLRSCTNTFYAGGTTRATVDEAISLNFLRRMARNLNSNHAKPVTRILAPSMNVNTSSVEASYLVFCHTDCAADIRDLPKFIHVSEYGTRKPVHEREIGACEEFRFILSPELAAVADAGAAVGSTGLVSTSASNIDVYPIIVTGQDAWGQLTLKGGSAFDVSVIPVGTKDKYDPLGQFGYVGAKFWFAADILNGGWMALGEAGITNIA